MNYYRNFERNWELNADLADPKIKVPSLFIAGEKDGVIGGATKEALETTMTPLIPDLRDVVLVPGMGHWIQQEDPEAAKLVVLRFFVGLTINETAELMEISPRKANMVWAYARAWLRNYIGDA